MRESCFFPPLLFGCERLKEVSQIDYDIADIDRFGTGSGSRDAAEVLVDSGELLIGCLDELLNHHAELLLCKANIFGRLHARNYESDSEYFNCSSENDGVGVSYVTRRVRFQIVTVILHLLQVLAGRIKSSHSQVHGVQGVVCICDALSARASSCGKAKRYK